ncbi:MAG: YqgE/AlgH family protein [Saprospirales bacterium]|nr:YqgE/AlgH family protein [Saprospirales bacterium]
MESTELKSGQILISEPFMWDSNFKRSVVLLCDHTEEDGSVGFILNKPMEMRIDELVTDFPEFDAPVFFGGPVQTDTVHYIHAVGDLLEGSTKVAPGVYWGGDFEKLKVLIRSELIKPQDIRFFVGYSGWSEGQLQDELAVSSWVISDMHANYIFQSSPEELWKQVLTNLGDTYTVIAQMPDYVNWN